MPGGGAIPSALSSTLDGPKRCSQDSAVTCGAIISGRRSRKPTGRRLGRSVIATATAKGAPITHRQHRAEEGRVQRVPRRPQCRRRGEPFEECGDIQFAAGRQGREQQSPHRQQAEQEDNGKDGYGNGKRARPQPGRRPPTALRQRVRFACRRGCVQKGAVPLNGPLPRRTSPCSPRRWQGRRRHRSRAP